MPRTSPVLVLTVSCAACSAAAPNPFCTADFNNDLTLNFFDVSAFVETYLNQDSSADLNGDGDLDFFDISAFLTQFLVGCPDLTDTDGDRIPDFAETDDGRFIDLGRVGTDPLNPDTDNDGIDDGDELLGTLGGLDLPALGADPLRRDIFVECDWFAGDFDGFVADYRPTPEVIAPIVDAFANAPVPNPYDAEPGISIHFDYGQGGPFMGGNQLPGTPLSIIFDFEFNIVKESHFEQNRRGYFHYAMFAHRYNDVTNTSSGVAELPGNDFMVTLSDYATPQIMTNTIMHELGHNLGLRHGGDENRNWKPNYNSVMNYRYQFAGVDTDMDALGDGPPDYSLGFSIALDENSIREQAGIDGVTPIDWDDDGTIDPDAYTANINCRFLIDECGGDAVGCWDDECNLLSDHDDWSAILWSRFETNVDRDREPEIVECATPGWILD